MTSLDLAAIGNCSIAALIDRRSDIVWSCFPRLDGEPVFNSLLGGSTLDRKNDSQRGFFSVELEGVARVEQSYVENTAILVSTQSDEHDNVLEITDFAPRFPRFGRMFRPPMLIRRLRPIRGRPRVRVRLRPTFDWGSSTPELTRGTNHIRYVGPQLTLRLTTDVPVSYVMEERAFLVDDSVSLILGSDETLRDEVATTTRECYERTLEFWRGWTRSLSIPFEWQDAVIRAAITLKLCNFEETGAIVAALTTSIPEAPGSQRNWDYRYCWLRDAYFVIQTLNSLGVTQTMEHFIGFIADVAADAPSWDLQPLYGITRERMIEERIAEALPGYRGMGPVRVGNAAYSQLQHDVYGSVVLASTHAFFDRRMIRPANTAWYERLERLAERAAKVFDQPDAGPWELRTKAAVHTFSSVMCWAALDRVSKIAAALGKPDRAETFRFQADRLHSVISERCWNAELNSFVSTFDGRELDATLLLLHELDFLPASDPRIVATVEAVGRGLRRDHLLLRYAVEDDFGKPRTAFLICTFWYIDALNAIGRSDEARDLFERVLSLRNSFGLFSEDVDLTSGELWGNFPQTYSMVGLINSAMRLSKSWEEAF